MKSQEQNNRGGLRRISALTLLAASSSEYPLLRPRAPTPPYLPAVDSPTGCTTAKCRRQIQAVRRCQRLWRSVPLAMHEGHLYGWMNQRVNLCTALGLVLLCTSALVMWWRRRPQGLFGAPVKRPNIRLSLALAGLICDRALYLPLFGITLVITIATEHLLLRRIPATRLWFGLDYAEKA